MELDQGLNSSLNEVKNLPVSCAEGSAHQCFSFNNRLAAIIECVALIKKKKQANQLQRQYLQCDINGSNKVHYTHVLTILIQPVQSVIKVRVHRRLVRCCR